MNGGWESAAGRGAVHRPQEEVPPSNNNDNQCCYQCGKIRHIAKDCSMRKSESTGTTRGGSTAQQITSTSTESSITSYLYQSDSSDDETVKKTEVQGQGSHSHVARVLVQGYPAEGIVDSGADIIGTC